MKRFEYLKKRCSENSMFAKLEDKLSEAEFFDLIEFIENNEHLDALEFEYAANRMFLDKPKPKNWTAIMELALIANGVAKAK